MLLRYCLAPLLLAVSAFAQVQNPALAPTWYLPMSGTANAVKEGDTLTLTSTVTIRYGQVASQCAAVYQTCKNVGDATAEAWTDPVTITATAAAPVTIQVGQGYFGSDPVPGVYKTIQIAETAALQSLTDNGQTVNVPALPAPPPPPPPPPAPAPVPPTQTVSTDGTLTIRIPPNFGLPVGECRVGSAGSIWYLICNGPIASNGTDTNNTGDNSTAPIK